MLLLPVKGFELWKSVWAGWLSLGVTWLVSGGHQLLINARLNADLRYHLLLWLLCNYAREVTSLSVVATMLLYNVTNITLTSKGRTSYWKLHSYNKNWYHLCPGYHSTMPNQCMSNLLLLFPNPHSWTRYNSWKSRRSGWLENVLSWWSTIGDLPEHNLSTNLTTNKGSSNITNLTINITNLTNLTTNKTNITNLTTTRCEKLDFVWVGWTAATFQIYW